MIMDIIVWVVLGLVMGYLARAILPGEQKIGLIPTLLVGALGAFIGAYVAKMIIGDEAWPLGFHWKKLLAALIGALVVLVGWCLIFRGKWN